MSKFRKFFNSLLIADRLRQRLEPLLNFEQNSPSSPFSVREIVDILRVERAEDIICIKVPVSDVRDRYVIICTPHNMRHGEAMVLAIRKCFKLKIDHQVCHIVFLSQLPGSTD